MMTRVPVASLEVSEPVLINNQGKTLQTNVIKDSEVKEEEKEVEEEVEEVEEVSSEVDSSQKKSTRRSR